jgi:putative transposase
MRDESLLCRLPQGFCVLDAYSRRCIGWHLSRDIDTRLALAALDAAISARRPSPGLIHHSDRGVQYASLDYVARLTQIGACPSMSAPAARIIRSNGLLDI